MRYNVDVNNMIIVIIAGFVPLLLMMIVFHTALRGKDRKKHTKTTVKHISGVYVFCFVLVFVLYITGVPDLLHFTLHPSVNVIPFYTLGTTLYLYILNMLLFVPIGFLLPMLWGKYTNVFRTLLCGFLFSLFIEILQLLNSRISDVDDLIMNTAGTLIGYCIFMLIKLAVHRNFAFAINRRDHWGNELFVCLLLAWLSMFFIQPFISGAIWGLILA